jgi:hypothetical protein
MCKEMPIIPVNRVVGPTRMFGKKWRATEEERHRGSLTKKTLRLFYVAMSGWNSAVVITNASRQDDPSSNPALQSFVA